MPKRPPSVNKDFRYIFNPSQWDEHDKKWFENLFKGHWFAMDNPYDAEGKYGLPSHEPEPEPPSLLEWDSSALRYVPKGDAPKIPPGWENSDAWKAADKWINTDWTEADPDKVGFQLKWNDYGKSIPVEKWTGKKQASNDFMETDFMKENREENTPLEKQLRWDDKRKKYIEVGKWMKEQEQEKARKAKHE